MNFIKSFDPDIILPPKGHYIGGEWHTVGETIPVSRPSDNARYGEIQDAGSEMVDAAVTNAQAALESSGWNTCSPRDRTRVLQRWAALIEEHRESLGQLEAVGSTRPIADAIGWDVPTTAECIRFFSEFADKHGGEVAATQADHLGLVIAEPIGIIGAIAPWNFPLVMSAWKCAPALAAGNAVVLKPSELTPFSISRLAELAVEAGLPAGIFNVVTGLGHTTGDAIVRHSGIGKVTFTGSTRTGSIIMAACAETGPKPVTLELGGKSPQVVFDDIEDIDQVAATISRAILNNAGQVCNAGSRLLVQRGIHQELIAKIVENTKSIKAGLTWQDDTNFPPIISFRQTETVSGIVNRALSEGASALVGGAAMETATGGSFFNPTVLVDVDSEMSAVQEEIFGPVLTVQVFEDDDQGIAMANDSRYGLAAGVYTNNITRALNAVRKIEAGNVWVNRYGRSADFIIPTGGYKKSGIGKDLGRQAYEANLRHKSALIAIQSS